MRINQTAAYAMYPRNVALPEVVCALNRAGIGNEDICMVLSPAHPDASVFDSEAASSARMIAWFSMVIDICVLLRLRVAMWANYGPCPLVLNG